MAHVELEPPRLEVRLIRLEEIVAALEREDLELEEALRLFEEGIAHVRSVRTTLAEAELRIEHLLAEEPESVVPGRSPGHEG
jgi:exodeoxyribonuclease VII small subunit